MRINDDMARQLTGRGGRMDTETIERETREEAGQIKSELGRLYDRVTELEVANAALLGMANAAEYRAGLAEDRARLYMECEGRAYREAKERLGKAADLALAAFSTDDDETRLDVIEQALDEIRVGRALTAGILSGKAVALCQKADGIEALLRSEMPVAVELVVEEAAS